MNLPGKFGALRRFLFHYKFLQPEYRKQTKNVTSHEKNRRPVRQVITTALETSIEAQRQSPLPHMSFSDSYKLYEPYDIDDGSLNGLSEIHCFVLGAEWETFRQRLESENRLTASVHSQNIKRLVAMPERHRRFVEDRPNIAPGWASIWVGRPLS